MKKTMLAIETSCDDTGIAVVEAEWRLPAGRQGFSNPKFKVIESLVSSQIKVHRPFGGVVPNLAKREHIKNLPLLLKKLLHSKFYILNSVDMIAVTVGPGLEPALWTGITFAQALTNTDKNTDLYRKSPFKSVYGLCKSVPLVGVNHLEGHLYSFLLSKSVRGSRFEVRGKNKIQHFEHRTFRTSNIFPAVALLASGGHTAILLMKNLKEWKMLGETRDDAAGEAFDKVARMLKLPYPGGPEIEKLAKKGDSSAIDFPKPMLYQKNYDFSFSGLKTSVFYYLRDTEKKKSKADIAASFQKTVIDVLIIKTMRAAKEHKARSVILCGGVAANKMLRKELKRAAGKQKMDFFVPDMEYNNDNGAMIAAAGYFASLRKKRLRMEADGGLNI